MKLYLLLIGVFSIALFSFKATKKTNIQIDNVSNEPVVDTFYGLPCINKTLQVYAHLIADAQGNITFDVNQVNASLDQLNDLMEPICVRFEMCEHDTIFDYNFRHIEQSNVLAPSDNQVAENSELAELANRYNRNNRINLYLVERLFDAFAPSPFAGLGSLNGISDNFGPRGAIWIQESSFGIGVLSHEMGHYLGLKHTFEGDGVELVDGSNCETVGDGFCDTPADPGTPPVETAGGNCDLVNETTDANGDVYVPDVTNIMSYYDCAERFSVEQYREMAKNVLNSRSYTW